MRASPAALSRLRTGRHAVVRRRAIGGVSLAHDEATKAVKQMLKNSATLRTEQREKGVEELRELKTSAALRRLWS